MQEDKADFSGHSIFLTLVRHGEDEQDKLGGWSANHLTEKGIQQVEKLTKKLSADYDFLLSSDLNRAKESAEILSGPMNMKIIYDEELRETNNGILKDLSILEFKERYPGLYFANLRYDEAYPGGESPKEFYERIRRWLFKIIEKYDGKKVLAVTHSGVISIIRSIFQEEAWSNKIKNVIGHACKLDLELIEGTARIINED